MRQIFPLIIIKKINWYIWRNKMNNLNEEYIYKRTIDKVGYLRILCKLGYWKQYNWRILATMTTYDYCITEIDEKTRWYWKKIADLPKRYVYSL